MFGFQTSIVIFHISIVIFHVMRHDIITQHGAPDLTDLTRPTRHDPTEPQISDTSQPRFFTRKNEGSKRPQASIRAASWPNLAPIMRLSARNAQKHSNKKIQKFAGVLSFKTEEIWMDSRMDAWTWKIHLEIQT